MVVSAKSGKIPKRGQKLIYEENVAVLKWYGSVSVISSVAFGFSVVCQFLAMYTMYSASKCVRNEKGQVIDAGVDLNESNELAEYCHLYINRLCVGSVMVAVFLSLSVDSDLPVIQALEIGIIQYCVSMSLGLECSDLKSRHASHSYISDEAYAEAVVEKIFCNSKYDLLSVFPVPPGSVNDDYTQVVDVIGTKSLAFQVLVEVGGDLFDFFVSSFALHLERSSCKLPFKIVQNSVYMHLLSDYVCYMMPTTEEPLIPSRNQAHYVTSPSSSPVGSPLKLIREDALRRFEMFSMHSLKSLNSYSRSLNGQLVSFLHVLIQNLTSLSSWPSDYRLCALRYVLKELHVFVLVETENAALAQIKAQLHCNPPFGDRLFVFFTSLFKKWPANISFSVLFDVWVTWIRPWRYVPSRNTSDIQRFMQFVQANARFYTDLSDLFWNRAFRFLSARDVRSVHSYITVLIAPELVNYYGILHYDIEEKLLTFANSIRLTIDDLRNLVTEKKKCYDDMNWFVKLLLHEPDTTIADLQDAIVELKSLVDIIKAASYGDIMKDNNEASSLSSVVDNELNAPRSFVEDRQVKKVCGEIPDHFIDPTTKMMYLSPLGRKQMVKGTHHFDLSNCSEAIPPLILPLRDNEIWWLSKLLYRLSVFLNRTKPLEYLSHCYDQENTLFGLLARLLLDPEYPRKVVPMFTTEVPFQKPCLNLRHLARYKIVVPFCIFLFLQLFLPFTYNFILSSAVFVFAYFCYS
uniref:Transmembrane protein 208 n=1 Tax=Syphacia muris TaxID=451379 RepID=A0A0N5AQF8_9BILA